jgi:MFS family permease
MNLPAAFAPLREIEFRRYYIGQLVSVLGTWMQAIALPWMAYRISGSAFIVGFVVFCGYVGQLFLPPIAGVFGDKLNKRKLLIWLYLLMSLPAIALAWLAFSGKAQVWQIATLSVLYGICMSIEMPIRWASFAEMLQNKSLLPNAIALNAAALNIGRVIGPAVGGALIAWVGETACFAVNAASFFVVAFQLSKAKWGAVVAREDAGNWWASFKEGASAAFSDPFVRRCLMMVSAVSFALGSYTTILPVFAKDVLKGDSQTLGALMSCMGIGALGSTLYLATRKGRGLPTLVIIAAFTGGTAFILLGLTRSLSLAPVLTVGLGIGMILTFATINTMIQLHVDADRRARVMGFYSWAVMGVGPPAAFFTGLLVEASGAPVAMIAWGSIAVIAGALFWRSQRGVVST